MDMSWCSHCNLRDRSIKGCAIYFQFIDSINFLDFLNKMVSFLPKDILEVTHKYHSVPEHFDLVRRNKILHTQLKIRSLSQCTLSRTQLKCFLENKQRNAGTFDAQ
ncbi:hypothetical protein PR048_020850 [Dryococelus australis]|uniref:Uncharacterized protein n=1 Tax=Dryococelus australis TaxID=614101 RepID=A0ABQ9GWK0_9NEOP|nr:hypothetical protein PR048_020850 [Dryococelus australis]